MEKKQLVFESINQILKPKGFEDVLNDIKNLPVREKLKKLRDMRSKWGDSMYRQLTQSSDIIDNIRSDVKKELSSYGVIDKINYVEEIEKELPEIFSNLKDKDLLKELKEHIINQDFDTKSALVWRFFKSWPALFKDVEDDPRIDPETNQLMLLFKIKGAMTEGNIESLTSLIQEMGKRYGRGNILDKAERIIIPDKYSNRLFNKKDIEQLKLSLYKETRSDEELERDEMFDVYAFIGFPDFKEKEIDGEKFHKKQLGIENLVKIDKYNSSSLSQVPMMKIRARSQSNEHNVWGVYIPKFMWDKDYAHNHEIPDDIRKFVDENKFKL